ncbi:class I adenylate-forming enzyme family protein [Amycolatopsis albispora]|uniref:Fatty-acid--CoA ligase n=1 Tax=Amycolatopsis albispora TaxID=1804986 RepID=A0A344L010_9PSEU|nr:fatty acid--CoA ligase family protein [Amycolatopsis albispora]AXB41384.1 fatty-acid--CoA ligase [Amycolatopsis albispora]
MGIADRIERLLREAPDDAEAIEHHGVWWSWGRLRACAQTADEALRAARTGPGARVGLILDNRPEHVAALAALLAGGRCAVVLNPLQPADRLAADIAGAGVSTVLGGSDHLAAAGLPTAEVRAVELGRDGAVRSSGGPDLVRPGSGPGVAFELFTSGTTGPPKRIALSYRQLDQALASAGQAPEPEALLLPSVSVIAAPLVHIGGLWGVLSALHTGRRMVLMTRFSVWPWVEAVERYRVRAAFLVPAALRDILADDVPRERLASLKLITSGSTVLPAELADSFYRRYGIRVLTTYGATEFAGAVAGWTYALHEKWWDRKAGSSGQAYPGVRLRVTGEAGAVLPAGQVGRLEVRTAQSARGAGAWVRTSDLARIDEDGFLWVVGRADDAINRGGFKVRPDAVRRALERHPAVREAAVAGLPDVRLGAVPVAAVELEPGQPRPAVAELLDLCRAELLPYELPRHVLLVDALPRSPSAKVSRTDVLELVRAALAEEALTP